MIASIFGFGGPSRLGCIYIHHFLSDSYSDGNEALGLYTQSSISKQASQDTNNNEIMGNLQFLVKETMLYYLINIQLLHLEERKEELVYHPLLAVPQIVPELHYYVS